MSQLNEKIQNNLKDESFILGGFMGSDTRNYPEIISEDQATLDRLGYTKKQIIDRLKELKLQAVNALEESIVYQNLQLTAHLDRGRLGCPFEDESLLDKTLITVKNLSSGQQFSFSSLHLHLIEAHDFWEGKGQPYRLEPELVVSVIF